MDIINKILTLEDLNIYSQEQILALVRQGYTLSTQSELVPIRPLMLHTQPIKTARPNIKTMQTDLGTVVIFILGTMTWAYIYYKLGGWEDQAIQNLAKKV